MKASSTALLNQIGTRWSLVERAIRDDGTYGGRARQELLDRYSGAVWRYLTVATQHESDAEELFQEFALRLIRGDFHRASPDRGQFRNYLKSIVVNLIRDQQRQRARRPRSLEQLDPIAEAALEPIDDLDERFVLSWRAELLHLTWNALEQCNNTLFHALRIQSRIPNASSAEKAELLAKATASSCDANRFRVTLCRARKRFANLLLHEVGLTLTPASDEAIQAELKRLRLAAYCGN